MGEEALILEIRQKNERAMQTLIDRYSRLLWKTAVPVLQNVGSEQDVEEVVADVFICLWEHPERFDPTRGSLKTLLCIMARTRAIDRYRELTRRSELPLEEGILAGSLGLQEQLLQEESLRLLRTTVNGLEEPGREILLRRYYYNQKPRTIARAMGLTVKQVDNSLYRTKGLLRKALTKEGV